MDFPAFLAAQAHRDDPVGKLARFAAETPTLVVTHRRKDLKFSLTANEEHGLFDAADQAVDEWDNARQAELTAEREGYSADLEAHKAQSVLDDAAEQEAAEKARAAKVAPDARVAKLKAQAAADARREAEINAEQAEREADAAAQVAEAEKEAADAAAALVEATVAEAKATKPRKAKGKGKSK